MERRGFFGGVSSGLFVPVIRFPNLSLGLYFLVLPDWNSFAFAGLEFSCLHCLPFHLLMHDCAPF